MRAFVPTQPRNPALSDPTALHDPLDIAILAHVRHPIAQPFMGGMEAHSWHLAAGLAARGHRVRLLASGDSRAPGELVAIVPRHYEVDFPWHTSHGTAGLNAHLDEIYSGALIGLSRERPDVVHNNALHRYPQAWAAIHRQPMVSAMHVPPFGALQRAVLADPRPWSLTTVTSRAQVPRWWERPPATASVVPNGIDPDAWRFDARGGGGAVWIGRITPNKAPGAAIRAAKAAGVPITLFGPIEHRDCFEDEVRPHLGPDVRYGGHLSSEALQRETGTFDLLVFTPIWDEPFGLVAIEAMACGLPVAFVDMGAVAEVVGPCGAGAARDDGAGLAAAIGTAMAIDRAACRARVLERFTLARMIDRFEALYRRAVAGVDLPILPDGAVAAPMAAE